MKQLLLIAGTAILLVAAPFVLWHLTDDPLERRDAPLLGEWRSTRDGRIRISFRIDEQQGCIAIRRPGACLLYTSFQLPLPIQPAYSSAGSVKQ